MENIVQDEFGNLNSCAIKIPVSYVIRTQCENPKISDVQKY
jgi:hypothetical protein